MSIGELEKYTRDIVSKLNRLEVDFAVIGGIAVSFRTIERTTKDLDLAVAIESDTEAERIVRSVSQSGYRVEQVLEHEVEDRLSTVRLISIGDVEIFVDLLFASSGIENEVVATAEEVEVFPSLLVRVATIPSLIALKVLSADMTTRLQDVIDLRNLLKDASPEDIEAAKTLMTLITERGYNRNKDLLKDFEGFCAER